jgi:anthranilate/para-aminobenzoate synthase component I
VLADEPVRAPPDPFELAQRLAGDLGLAVLASTETTSRWGARSFVGSEPDASTAAWDPCELDAALLPDAPFPRWIGVLPYEARRSLERARWVPDERRPAPGLSEVEWRRYPAVLVVDHRAGTVRAVGASAARCRDLARRAGTPAPAPPRARRRALGGEAPEAHRERVRRAVELIYAGDLYQVNLARALDVALDLDDAVPTDAHRIEALRVLAKRAKTPFAALLSWPDRAALSTSPELFLDVAPREDGRFDLLTEPIKGTRPRHADAALDAAAQAELDGDEKERAELAMIVDVERNDLARVSEIGSVQVTGPPRVESFATVHHRVATIRSRTREGVGRREILEAMWPSGSVTGAPKVRAMEVIASLEPVRRGLYTGALGYVGHDGSMRLSMAIRCAELGADGRGRYLAGGGITFRSDPDRELEETRWKAAQLDALPR